MVGCAVVLAVVGVGLITYTTSPAHRRHAPNHSLQQLDLLYLDQPAPLLDELGIQRGRPTLIVVCQACIPPPVDARVVVTGDPRVARAYALARADGRVVPGYAVVDASGHVRYRTFDPGLSDHGREIEILLGAVR